MPARRSALLAVAAVSLGLLSVGGYALPAPAAGLPGPHLVGLGKPGDDVSDVPVSRLERVQRGSMIKVGHPPILPAPSPGAARW